MESQNFIFLPWRTFLNCEEVAFQGGLKAIISIGVIHAFILASTLVTIAAMGIYHVGIDDVWNRSVGGGRIISPE